MYEDLKKLSPAKVWESFAAIANVPRPSGHREPIREFLVSYGKSLGLETLTDAIGNVLIRKPASAGKENCPGIILQAHMDMVPQKHDKKNFNFETDPIEAHVEGEWVKADNTTLGADNGIGVAIAMALLADKSAVHPPLEALFTVDEETGMYGAYDIKANWMKGKYLLNLDSETEGMLFVGCAGGLNGNATLKIECEDLKNKDNYRAVQVEMNDCRGGHSGCDIHLQRANAIKTLFRWVKDQEDIIEVADAAGGSLRNAIPRSAKVVVVFPKDKYDEVVASVKKADTLFKSEYKNIEDQMHLSCNDVAVPDKILSKACQKSLINGILACPHGVYRMFQDLPGVVETSDSVAMLEKDNGNFVLTSLLRSNRESRKKELRDIMEITMVGAGWQIEFSGDYPGWQPNMDSQLLKTMREVYNKEFGREPEVLVIHAGLECGIIGSKYPDMEMISFGPTIEHPHSPDERVNIKSVEDCYKFVVASLKAF